MMAEGRLDEAEAVFDEGLRCWPDSMMLYGNRSNLHVLADRSDLAIADLTAAIERAGDENPWAIYGQRGRLHGGLRHHCDAVADLSRAIEMAPPDAEPEMFAEFYFCLALNRFGAGDSTRARVDVAEALRLCPDNARYRAFQRDIEHSEDVPEVDRLGMRAAECMGQNKDGEAHDLLDRILRISPDHAKALQMRAECKRRMQGPLAALPDLTRSYEIDGNELALYNRAQCFLQAAQFERARVDFETYLRIGRDAHCLEVARRVIETLGEHTVSLNAGVQVVVSDGTCYTSQLTRFSTDALDALFHHDHTPHGRATSVALHVGTPWFNPNRACDREVLGVDMPPRVLEIDSLALLEHIAEMVPRSLWWDTLVYQHWPPTENGSRAFQVLMPSVAPQVAEAMHPLPIRQLYIVATGFYSGAIQAFAERLAEGARTLETLGLFWYFCGDDITDVPSYPQEIATAVRLLQVERLSLLTTQMCPETERRLAEALTQCPTLVDVSVFQKASSEHYPRIVAPRVDIVISRHREARVALRTSEYLTLPEDDAIDGGHPPWSPLAESTPLPSWASRPPGAAVGSDGGNAAAGRWRIHESRTPPPSAEGAPAPSRDHNARIVDKTPLPPPDPEALARAAEKTARRVRGTLLAGLALVLIVSWMTWPRSKAPARSSFTIQGKSVGATAVWGGALEQDGVTLARVGDPVHSLLDRLGKPDEALSPMSGHNGFYVYERDGVRLLIRVEGAPRGPGGKILSFELKEVAR